MTDPVDPPRNTESVENGPDIEVPPLEDDPSVQEQGVTTPKEV